MASNLGNELRGFPPGQIRGILNALDFKKAGGRIHLAIDYCELTGYAAPDYDSLLSAQETDVDFYKTRIALTYLIDQPAVSEGVKFHLLQPYRDELEEGIELLERSRLQKRRINRTDLIEKFGSALLDNPDLKVILDKPESNPEFTAEARTRLLDLLQADYLELYYALTKGSRKSVEVLRSFLNNKNVPTVQGGKYCESLLLQLPETRSLEEGAMQWYRPISRRRRDVRPITNLRDALALEYLVQINRLLVARKELMVLVTSSRFDTWVGIKPMEIDLDGKALAIPYTFDPRVMFAYEISVETNSGSDSIDYARTLHNLAILLDIQEDLNVLYNSLYDTGDSEAPQINQEVFTRLNEIGDKVKTFENLKAALRTSASKDQEALDELFLRVTDHAQGVAREFGQRFRGLVDLIRLNPEFKNRIDQTAETILEDVQDEFAKIADWVSIEVMASKVISTSPAGFLLDENDFRSDTIRRIIVGLRGNEEYPDVRENEKNAERLRELYRLKQDVRFDQGPVPDENWEAYAVLVQLKLRLRLEKWALNDCRNAVSRAPIYIQELLRFLQVIALSRDDMSVAEAIEQSKQLVQSHGESEPRYLLQLAYLMWMAVRRELGNYNLREPAELASKALDAAKTDETRYGRCLTLALADLANFCLDEGKTDKAEEYVRQLKERLGDSEYPPIWQYTRTRHKLVQLASNFERWLSKDEREIARELQEIDVGLMRLRHVSETEIRGPFFVTLQDSMREDFAATRQWLRVCLRINQAIRRWHVVSDARQKQAIETEIESDLGKIDTTRKCVSFPVPDLGQKVLDMMTRLKLQELGGSQTP